MRSLALTVRSPRISADAAYDRIRQFETYPDLVDEVRSVVIHADDGGGPITSDWEVYFRNGPLRWSEVDYFQKQQRRIIFEQTTGDFDVFRGTWAVEPLDAGCEVTFSTTFDFGIPSLAGILEPIAVKVLKEGIALVLHRLLEDAVIVDDPSVQAAVVAKLADSQRPVPSFSA
jgi:ribosome-associated toxin RatA of RatAB toxin-antitoxin module